MTIEIKDLPMLEELTPEQLKEMFGAGKFRPEFEVLEDRFVMSTMNFSSGLSILSSSSSAQSATPATTAPVQIASIASDAAPPAGGQVALDSQTALIPDAATPASAFNADQAKVESGAKLSAGALPVLDLPIEDLFTQGKKAVDLKVAELGGRLGTPLPQTARPSFDGYGVYQDFTNGSVIWSVETGAHYIYGAIREKYFELGREAFGYPKNDESDLSVRFPGARFNDFYKSGDASATRTIVWTAETGAHVVSGVIRAKWIEQGAGNYGVPLGEQYAVGARPQSGLAQDFRYFGGYPVTIAWSQQTGAHDMLEHTSDFGTFGARARWLNLGGAEGIGFPTTDQVVGDTGKAIVHFMKVTAFTDDDGNPIIHRSAISNISITMVNNRVKMTQVYVYGYIYNAWMKYGGQNWGMPITEEMDAGNYRYTRFTTVDGIKEIQWYKDSNKIHVKVTLPSGQEVYTKSSDAFTVETDVFQAGANVIQDVVSYPTAPEVTQTSSLKTTSFMDQWSAGLAAHIEDNVGLFGHEWDGVTLNSAAWEDGISWYSTWLDEASTDAGVGEVNQTAHASIDLTGVSFSLVSVDTGETHVLRIDAQTSPLDASAAVRQRSPGDVDGTGVRQRSPNEPQMVAAFSALWDPDNDGGFPATGTLWHDDAGNVHIHFSWVSREDGTYHNFDGTLTGQAGSYHIDGTATARPDGVPQQMAGDQVQVTALTSETSTPDDRDMIVRAAQLARDLGLYLTGEEYYNSNGVEEKWLMGDRGWYFMLPDGGLYEWDGQNSATGTLVATLDPSYHEDLTRLTEADAHLQQVAGKMDLQTPQDPLEQGVIDNTRLQSAIQTAVAVLAGAEQDLADKSDALARVEEAVRKAEAYAQISVAAFQNQSSQLQAAQDRVTAANTAYQKARKAMNSASGKKRVQLQKKVTAAMVKLNTARAAFEIQSAAALEAESAMNLANEAVENAADARDQARNEMDSAVAARAVAAQNLDALHMQPSRISDFTEHGFGDVTVNVLQRDKLYS